MEALQQSLTRNAATRSKTQQAVTDAVTAKDLKRAQRENSGKLKKTWTLRLVSVLVSEVDRVVGGKFGAVYA